jgi:cystathionine beta-lyase/cystathionine gamma-synthase
MRLKLNSTKELFSEISQLLDIVPTSWVELTTHRLDIYDEDEAKSQFLSQLQELLSSRKASEKSLELLPTAYDYIRLGHQLSSVLEWVIAEINGISSEQVITFSSKIMPVLAMLRRNALNKTNTFIYYNSEEVPLLDEARLKEIYGYQFKTIKVVDGANIPAHKDATVLFVTKSQLKDRLTVNENIDATINLHSQYGSTLLIHNRVTPNAEASSMQIESLIKDVQHVRRRETIAMTPPNALSLLREIIKDEPTATVSTTKADLESIYQCIQQNTGSTVTPLIASSGLSIQYAIMMGLVEDAKIQHPNKPIAIILPPNCYGGTNDQARRIVELIPNVEIVDLLVDGDQDLVNSLEVALTQVASNDGVPIVLAEIPTNPRVEVPDMNELARVLNDTRKTSDNNDAIEPSFMVDQTFCPNVRLLHKEAQLADVKVISFSSGSKFPSGGRCVAGYCAVNNSAKAILDIISKHLLLSDNGAASHQLNTLAENMPSMPERIKQAYQNTLEFVNYVQNILPDSKINFVSEELAQQGFTPSVFSIDLPTMGETKQERDEYQRTLNKKLIDFMIKRHPDDCKHCVSYGQLKGSYWTIPATSTQGTTKENDKDYIVRVALAPTTDVAKLSESFSQFFKNENLIS